MKKIVCLFLIFGISSLVGCDSTLTYDDFIAVKGLDKFNFQTDEQQCQIEGELVASQSEGSKRAGEILLDTKYYKMSCMRRKGWIQKKGT